jgi:N-acetylglucosamine kinase-like BadF-type ATPase
MEMALDSLSMEVQVDIKDLPPETMNMALALPGAGAVDDQALAKISLLQPYWASREHYTVLDDTWAGLVAGTFTCRGTCAFAGTGASIYVNDKDKKVRRFYGKPHKIDGWGPIIGDFGSGFQLAVHFFRFINRQYDRGIKPDLFIELVKREPAIRELKHTQRWFDTLFLMNPNEWRTRFAKLAAVVTSAAELSDPDPDAEMLVQKAANEMIESIKIALERFPHARNFPVVFQGGMFEHSRLYRRLVTEAIESEVNACAYLALFRPVVGAVLLAMADEEQSVGPFVVEQSVIRELHSSILKLPDEEQHLLIAKDGHAPFDEEESDG